MGGRRRKEMSSYEGMRIVCQTIKGVRTVDEHETRRFKIETDLTRVEVVCIRCHSKHFLLCPTHGLKEWKGGKYIQDALPMLSPSERELMISHLCHDCFEESCKELEEF